MEQLVGDSGSHSKQEVSKDLMDLINQSELVSKNKTQ
jgi:hypothetical protein